MSREKLTAAAQDFLQRVLPAATGRQFSQLEHADVLLGAYRRYSGAAIQSCGRSFTPEFMLQVSRTPVAAPNGVPALGTGTVAADAPNQPLVWLRFVADAKVDDEATIRDLMGDLDTYTERRLRVAGVEVDLGEGAQLPPGSQQWAQAIVANRAQLPENLNSLTEVPSGLRGVASTPAALRFILNHFFTYDQGAYYQRWSGAGREIPQGLTEAYLQKNIREAKLVREQMYLYMLAPKRLFTADNAEAHDYREAVIRFDETGDRSRPFVATLVHCVYRRIEAAQPFHDFVFFEAEDGIGLPIPAAARTALSPAVAQYLTSIPSDPAARSRFFQTAHSAVGTDQPLVQLLATIEGTPQYPAGVLASPVGQGKLHLVKAPPEKVMDVAALPEVKYLALAGNAYRPCLDLARTAVDFGAYRSAIPADKQDGQGVIVGIVDTGIDGAHPAFRDAAGNSRILAVWAQDEGLPGNANSPKAKHPGNAAYNLWDYGREYTGADVVNARDSDTEVGHGTHVAGIAAGAEVTTATEEVPPGFASKARIVAVRCIGVRQGVPEDAVQYIFQKAAELNLPCVINMSFSSQDHGHDGTDEMSRLISQAVHVPAGNAYVPGRILVAAAANDRGEPIHVRRDVRSWRFNSMRVRVNPNSDPISWNDVTMWARPSTSASPFLLVWVTHEPSNWSSFFTTSGMSPSWQVVPGQDLRTQTTFGAQDIHNGDYNIRVEFRTVSGNALPAEIWRISILNLGDDVELHAWAPDFSDHGKASEFQDLTPQDDSYLIGSPAAAFDVVGVASYNTRLNWTDIDAVAGRNFSETRPSDLSSFSSPGPLRTCSNMLLSIFNLVTLDLTPAGVDVAAPGSALCAALASSVDQTDADNRRRMRSKKAQMLQGTSMASPVVTGLVACLLAHRPNLTQADVLRLVRGAGHIPAAPPTHYDAGNPDPDDWGRGLIHAPELLNP